MRFYQRHSFFPMLLALLTLLLAVVMFNSFSGNDVLVTETTIQTLEDVIVEPIDSDAYRTEISEAMQLFNANFDSTTDDLSKLLAVENIQGELLAMVVPTEYKELHLSLVVSLYALEQGLRSSDRSVETLLSELELLQAQYPWLTD